MGNFSLFFSTCISRSYLHHLVLNVCLSRRMSGCVFVLVRQLCSSHTNAERAWPSFTHFQFFVVFLISGNNRCFVPSTPHHDELHSLFVSSSENSGLSFRTIQFLSIYLNWCVIIVVEWPKATYFPWNLCERLVSFQTDGINLLPELNGMVCGVAASVNPSNRISMGGTILQHYQIIVPFGRFRFLPSFYPFDN